MFMMAPIRLRDVPRLLWYALTSPAFQPLPLATSSVRITCPHCGKAY